jgi:enamine deaminase RidA (YjgF/YER057c/UK114 family)
MGIDVINPDSSKRLYENFHFSQAVLSNGLLICSGQLGTAPGGSVPADLAEEFRAAWNAVARVLQAGGARLNDILEYTTFHVGLQQTLPTFMRVRDEFIAPPWPAWTAIGVAELAIVGAHVEIRVIARQPR